MNNKFGDTIKWKVSEIEAVRELILMDEWKMVLNFGYSDEDRGNSLSFHKWLLFFYKLVVWWMDGQWMQNCDQWKKGKNRMQSLLGPNKVVCLLL